MRSGSHFDIVKEIIAARSVWCNANPGKEPQCLILSEEAQEMLFDYYRYYNPLHPILSRTTLEGMVLYGMKIEVNGKNAKQLIQVR